MDEKTPKRTIRELLRTEPNVSESTVRRGIRDGRLPAEMFLNRYVVAEDEFHKFLRGGEATTFRSHLVSPAALPEPPGEPLTDPVAARRKALLEAIEAASGGGPWVTRPRLAKLENIETNTQAKRDRAGRGPGGCEPLSATVRAYPKAEVIAWYRGRGLL